MSSDPVVPINRDTSITDSARVRSRSEIAGELPIASDVTVPQPDIVRGDRKRDAAETVGAAFGKAVVRVRELPRRMADMKQRFIVIKGRTREDAASTAGEIRENARQKVYEARTRAEHLAHEYPIEFILGAGATAFVLGFALRIWRSSRRA